MQLYSEVAHRSSTTTGTSSIREGGAQALASMRRLVSLLRADDESTARGSQPTLADLDDLLDRARADGLEVTLISDSRTQLPHVRDQATDEVELAIYRIVQEALSNARRYAPGAAVAVAVERQDGGLVVEVVDEGGTASPARTGQGGGHGIIGMWERVHLLGGTIEIGPRQSRGWRVRARIPVDPRDEAQEATS